MVTDPNLALVMIALGILGIEAEFCLPGKVIPGIAGGVLLLLGTASLLNLPPAADAISWSLLASLFVSVAFITTYLLRAAARARRNKKID